MRDHLECTLPLVFENQVIESGDLCAQVNKVDKFNYNIGFVTQPSTQNAFNSKPIDMAVHEAYLSLVSQILATDLPNYYSLRVPLPSVFNWDYLQQHIGSYHDGRLMDYLKYGFPLGLASRGQVLSNAVDNHSSANEYAQVVDAFLCKEIKEGALFGLCPLTRSHILHSCGHHK